MNAPKAPFCAYPLRFERPSTPSISTPTTAAPCAACSTAPPAWVSIPYTVLYQDGRWRIAGVEGFEQYRVPSYKAFLQRLMPKG
jgi:hypothetical protein